MLVNKLSLKIDWFIVRMYPNKHNWRDCSLEEREDIKRSHAVSLSASAKEVSSKFELINSQKSGN